ncbi:MAG: hypothetical protein IJL76_03780 [Bacilli bacterium]|nr:hypothetical protein [Bacilli bacterium]
MAEEAKTGYNYVEMANLFTEVSNIATQTKRIVSKYLNDDLIDPMSKLWYAPEAREFFKKFQAVVREAEEEMDGAFQGFIDSLYKAQKAWSVKTKGGETAESITIRTEKIFLYIAKFKDQREGNIYIDEKGALTFVEGLNTIQQKLTNELMDQKADLTSAALAFVGNNQAEGIQKCFDKVVSSISDIFDFLTKGDTSLKSEIIRVTNEYRSFALRIKAEMEEK